MELKEPSGTEFPEFLQFTTVEGNSLNLHRDVLAGFEEKPDGTHLSVFCGYSERARSISPYRIVRDTRAEILDQLDRRVCACCGIPARVCGLNYVSVDKKNHWLCSECRPKFEET